MCCTIQLSLSGMTGSVFSVSVSSTGALACSGGEDDRGLAWNLENGTTLFECHGNLECDLMHSCPFPS